MNATATPNAGQPDPAAGNAPSTDSKPSLDTPTKPKPKAKTGVVSELEKVAGEVKTEVESITSRVARFEKHFGKKIDHVFLDVVEHVFGKVP